MTGTICVRVDRPAVPGTDPSESGHLKPDQRIFKPQDRLLLEMVRTALRQAGHSPIGELEIEISEGVVSLWGRVASYYQKQLAQAIVQRVAGVRGVTNGLEVVCQRTNSLAGEGPIVL